METIFVYGSLKEGLYNHYLLGGKFAKLLQKEATTAGRMYSRGDFPVLYKGDDTIHGEIWDVPDEAFHRIVDMELNAGYSLEKRIINNKYIAFIFLYHGNEQAEKPSAYIASGNWVQPEK